MRALINTSMLAMSFGVIFGLMGCGESKQEQPAATEKSATSAPAAGKKKYTVITTGTADPFSVKDERGAMSGIDIDLVNEIAKSEGFAVEFFELPWQQVLPAIENGEYDIAINGINYSDERAAKYGVTNPYFYNPSAFMYKKDAPQKPTTLAELSGLKVAVMKDAKQDLEVSAVQGADALRKPNLYSAYKAMLGGEAQVVAYDMAVMQSMLKKHSDGSAVVVPYEDKNNKNTYNVIIVNRNNQELLNTLNAGLEKLSQNGKIDEIRKKYVGE